MKTIETKFLPGDNVFFIAFIKHDRFFDGKLARFNSRINKNDYMIANASIQSVILDGVNMFCTMMYMGEEYSLNQNDAVFSTQKEAELAFDEYVDECIKYHTR